MNLYIPKANLSVYLTPIDSTDTVTFTIVSQQTGPRSNICKFCIEMGDIGNSDILIKIDQPR